MRSRDSVITLETVDQISHQDVRLQALTYPLLWGFFSLWSGGRTGSIVSWVMGYNSLSKEAAVTHMGRKADSTETDFVLPILREKRQGVT